MTRLHRLMWHYTGAFESLFELTAEDLYTFGLIVNCAEMGLS